jgi:hypothetical protein
LPVPASLPILTIFVFGIALNYIRFDNNNICSMKFIIYQQ